MTNEFQLRPTQTSWIHITDVGELPLTLVSVTYKCPKCNSNVDILITIQDLFGCSSDSVCSAICQCDDEVLIFEMKPLARIRTITVPDEAWWPKDGSE